MVPLWSVLSYYMLDELFEEKEQERLCKGCQIRKPSLVQFFKVLGHKTVIGPTVR